MAEKLIDGNLSWSGGMDASRFPSIIDQDQYHRGCNVQLRKSSGGLSSRDGIHHVMIDFNNHNFAENIYKYGHVQAEGWFNDGYKDFLLVAVNGYIIILEELVDGYWSACLMNKGDQNNPEITKGWFTRIPYGSIYNDGESLPFYISSNEIRRTDPSVNEIGVGRMGIYVQNRLFYSSSDGKEVFFSDFRNPVSRSEAINANLLSFVVPEDEDEITAIGKQKSMLNYTEGGVLQFSTIDNIYSVDVRGAIENWEEASGIGKIQESIRGIGAASAYSFEPFNTNIYFRSREYGLCNLKRSQFQFTQDDDFTSQSIEVDYWLENDTEFMLDQCYTRGYKGRLYTTIAPEFRSDGYVYWNGLISYHPNPSYSGGNRTTRRFEGIITGVRPWCMTVVKSENKKQRMFVHSHDIDGVNRLYRFVDVDYDLNHNNRKVEIESWVETRGFDFQTKFIPKNSSERYCKIRNIPRDLKVRVYGRTESSGQWSLYHNSVHIVGGLKRGSIGQIVPANIKPQNRDHVPLSDENDIQTEVYGNISGKSFFSRQDRFEFKGSFILDRFIREATIQSVNKSIEQEDTRYQSVYKLKPDFSYNIATSNESDWNE